jgi:hypothetical protein
MNIKTETLEKLLELTVVKLKELKIESVQIEKDYYWTVISSEFFVSNNTQPVLGVASLEDDLTELMNKLNSSEDILFYDFCRVASLLVAISETLNPSANN